MDADEMAPAEGKDEIEGDRKELEALMREIEESGVRTSWPSEELDDGSQRWALSLSGTDWDSLSEAVFGGEATTRAD